MDVVAERELVIVPLPETNVHAPVPTPGVLAFIVVVGEDMQSVWFEPALEIFGTCLTTIVIVETDGAQGAFEIVHANTLFPNPNPVIAVVGESEFVIVPLPETKVHTPVPTVAEFAAINVFGFEIHKV